MDNFERCKEIVDSWPQWKREVRLTKYSRGLNVERNHLDECKSKLQYIIKDWENRVYNSRAHEATIAEAVLLCLLKLERIEKQLEK